MSGRDPRFAELDRLIAAGKGEEMPIASQTEPATASERPKATRKPPLAYAAQMRAENLARFGKAEPEGWWIEGKWVRKVEQPWLNRRRKYLREKS